ncbi:uncharacterized protein EDB93DRAFT_1144154 [Suillus bovinus]|uniref:uncharacterized protein n=1 Tax=Suillus bovinus TaxID=48563 RepID=UPI001B868095|nr:uncharacterized protein EDB93DRAFT_1144154 [Suillus bovinus]KAG2148662.1 hypothetical protein EDB93DRAFT_1144154 [Suillus bovinus]
MVRTVSLPVPDFSDHSRVKMMIMARSTSPARFLTYITLTICNHCLINQFVQWMKLTNTVMVMAGPYCLVGLFYHSPLVEIVWL